MYWLDIKLWCCNFSESVRTLIQMSWHAWNKLQCCCITHTTRSVPTMYSFFRQQLENLNLACNCVRRQRSVNPKKTWIVWTNSAAIGIIWKNQFQIVMPFVRKTLKCCNFNWIRIANACKKFNWLQSTNSYNSKKWQINR